MAWPSVRAEFGLPLSGLGVLLASYTGAYLLGGAASGVLVERIGTGRLLAAAAFTAGLGVTGYAVTRSWAVLVVASVPVGAGNGVLDAALNAYVAMTHSPRVLNLLHAAFGVGATLGPLLFAALLAGGVSWRWGFAAIVVTQMAMAVAFWSTRHRWVTGRVARPAGEDRPWVADRRVVPLSLVVFFVYVGLEAGAGQWSYSALTEDRGLSAGAAGLWVGAYWASLTVGRVLAGLWGGRVAPTVLLRGSLVTAVAGAALVGWGSGPSHGAVGLPVLGLGLAAVFPTLVALTPARVGAGRAARVIGLEVAVAALGGGVLPGLMGLVLDARGLGALGPLLVGLAVSLLVLDGLLTALTSPATATPGPMPTLNP